MVGEKIKRFHKEFRKSASTAIIAGFSFLVALSWRDVISNYVEEVLGDYVHEELLIAVVVTAIAVLGIMVVSRLIPTEK